MKRSTQHKVEKFFHFSQELAIKIFSIARYCEGEGGWKMTREMLRGILSIAALILVAGGCVSSATQESLRAPEYNDELLIKLTLFRHLMGDRYKDQDWGVSAIVMRGSPDEQAVYRAAFKSLPLPLIDPGRAGSHGSLGAIDNKTSRPIHVYSVEDVKIEGDRATAVGVWSGGRLGGYVATFELMLEGGNWRVIRVYDEVFA